MTRLLLLTLAVLSLAPGVLARETVWTGKRIPVYDATPAEWQPLVAATVAEFNAVLPKRAPRLVYQAIPEQPCQTPPTARGSFPRGITVCVVEGLVFGTVSGNAGGWSARHVWRWVQITLGEAGPTEDRDRVLCHEFMHALSGIPDIGPTPNTYTNPESCVHGLLATPGAFDVAYLARVYRKHGR